MQKPFKTQAQLLGSVDYNGNYHSSVNKVTIRQQFTSNMEPLVYKIIIPGGALGGKNILASREFDY